VVTASRGIRYCVVEGSSGSGKSSTARALAHAWGQRNVVGEYVDFFGALSIAMPELPPPDRFAGRAQSGAWARVDRVRYAELRSLPGGAHPVVLDTSVVSVLACEMAKREVGEVSLVMEIASEYRRLLDDGTLYPPVFWVFLEAPYAELERRIAERGGSRPFLRRPDVAAYIEAFRKSFADRYLADDEYIRVSTDRSPVHDVVAAITAYALGRVSAGEGAGLSRFIDDMVRVEAAP
jgi:thymidylate kinase